MKHQRLASRMITLLGVALTTTALLHCGSTVPGPESEEPLPGAPEPDTTAARAAGAVMGRVAKVVNTGGLGLRLRKGPGTGYAVLKVLRDGATADVVAGPSNGWYQLRWLGTVGWSHGDFLVPLGNGKNNLLPWAAGVSYEVTQGHNTNISHYNRDAWAWDFGLPEGTEVLAAHFGTVRMVKKDSTTGCCSSSCGGMANYVVLDQGNGYESLYLHLKEAYVSQGQWVNRGDRIGRSGKTGWVCGPHLHFAVQRSPDNGGGTGWYNQSVPDAFYDSGAAVDYQSGVVISRNGTANVP